MTTTCPSCGRTFPIRSEHVGKKGKCPKCGERFVVDEDAAEASIVPDEPKRSVPVPPPHSSNTTAKAGKPNRYPMTTRDWCLLSAIPISFIFFCCGVPILMGVLSPPAAKNVPVQQAAPAQPPATEKVVEPVKDECEGQDTMAFVMSQHFIKKLLKAPSTADFPWAPDEDFTIQYIGNCTYQVKGYVDSENSFGAMIRSKYYIELHYNAADETWTAKSPLIW